jgi:hypothetical protein
MTTPEKDPQAGRMDGAQPEHNHALEYIPLQVWGCSQCGRGGEIERPPGVDDTEAFVRAHLEHIVKSPECAALHGAIYIELEEIAPVPES